MSLKKIISNLGSSVSRQWERLEYAAFYVGIFKVSLGNAFHASVMKSGQQSRKWSQKLVVIVDLRVFLG